MEFKNVIKNSVNREVKANQEKEENKKEIEKMKATLKFQALKHGMEMKTEQEREKMLKPSDIGREFYSPKHGIYALMPVDTFKADLDAAKEEIKRLQMKITGLDAAVKEVKEEQNEILKILSMPAWMTNNIDVRILREYRNKHLSRTAVMMNSPLWTENDHKKVDTDLERKAPEVQKLASGSSHYKDDILF